MKYMLCGDGMGFLKIDCAIKHWCISNVCGEMSRNTCKMLRLISELSCEFKWFLAVIWSGN